MTHLFVSGNPTNSQTHFHEKLLITRLDAMCTHYKKYLNTCFDAQMSFYLRTKALHKQVKSKHSLLEETNASEIKHEPKPETHLQYLLKRYNTVCKLHHTLRNKEENSIKIKHFHTIFYSKENQLLFNKLLDVWGSHFLKIVDELLSSEWSERFSHAVLVFRKKYNETIIKNVPLN